MNEIEDKFMRRALQLASLGRGAVSPNPMVGAVIVHNDKIIGEGFHRHFGEGHAEVNAIASVKDKTLLKDSTIYVTLEPCSHFGKTPPCANLIISSGIPRVVIGSLDPFIKVQGRGVKMLRDAGVEVVTGVMEDQCKELNRIFMTAHTLHRPYVLLKWAQSKDNYIDIIRTPEQPAYVFSNELSSMWVHRERAAFDAILVGAGTVKMDNPSLTVRNWVGKNPLRVILDANSTVPEDSRVLTDGVPTLIYTKTESRKNGHVEYAKIGEEGLEWILQDLYSRGITSVMVEGGASVLGQFYKSALWDEIRVETADVVLSDGIMAPKIIEKVKEITYHAQNRIEKYMRSVKIQERAIE